MNPAMRLEDLVGRKLKKDLILGNGVVLIPAGTVLENEQMDFLGRHYIGLDRLELEPISEPERPLATNEPLINQATQEIREVFHYMRRTGKVPMEEVQRSILPTISQAAEYPSLYNVLSGLQAKDDYTYRHNIGVGVISTMLGKWLQLEDEMLGLLTTAATLHDVGKIHIDDDLLNKPGRFTDKEYELMKMHTIFGHDIISNTPGLHPDVALAALQHHEREDGRGYPYGINGSEIAYFSKIVAVADVFHAMTSKRAYKEASPFYEVMQQMITDGFGKLDPVICNLFVHRMMDMSVGSDVVLTDGRQARILNVHPGDPIHPSVLAGHDYIDLRMHRQLHIKSLVG
ncbi:MAG: rpfG 6 [Paenibacillus sp.]|nr:rpfG 6 [Paenibacillus sp.]